MGSQRAEIGANVAVVGSQDFTPYGVVQNVTGSFSNSFAFTGEPLDANGLQYHRARYYDTAMGVWASLDPFEGLMDMPMSLNGYGYVEGNVSNRRDPSGYVPMDIWISAFISPSTIKFPLPYGTVVHGVISEIVPGLDTEAIWHGDGRSWFDGGDNPSARVWVRMQFDTTNRNSLKWQTDTGVTQVWFTDISGREQHWSKKALPPGSDIFGRQPVQIQHWDSESLEISVRVQSGNPLTEGSPAIDFAYAIRVLPCEEKLEIYAWHDSFPWHEVYVQMEGEELISIRDAPSGPTYTPADLIFPAIRPTLHAIYDSRLGDGCGVSMSNPSRVYASVVPENVNICI